MWLKLDSTRVYRQADGYIIVKSIDSRDIAPVFCPVCELPIQSTDDVYCCKSVGCCEACSLCWVDIHRERWEQGWRPEPADVKRELIRRNIRPKVPSF